MKKNLSIEKIINTFSNEKGLSKEILIQSIKEAILETLKKKYKMLNLEIQMDIDKSKYKIYAIYKVIENQKNNISIRNSFKEIPINYAKNKNFLIKIGEKIKKEIKNIDFQRIDIQKAKYVINKKIKKEEERELIKKLEKNKENILIGSVKNIKKNYLIINLNDNIEGIISKKNIIKNESFGIGDKIKSVFIEIKNNKIYLSRTSNEMLKSLLKSEIPEINENLIEIKDIARENGVKSKVSINSISNNIDPIGACIGIRGFRIQNISKELNGEKIDIILWNNDIIKYIINIFSPIKIKSIEKNEKKKIITVNVKKENLPRIIGKKGTNIKLINKMIKWGINIKTYD